jgi:hypothetical protein
MRLVRSLLLALVVAAGLPAAAAAQDKIEIRETDSLKLLLERHVGKRVGLVMRSGQELSGTVVKVGQHVVHVSELTGREFFDAVVQLDQLQAVVVRVRGR